MTDAGSIKKWIASVGLVDDKHFNNIWGCGTGQGGEQYKQVKTPSGWPYQSSSCPVRDDLDV